MRHRVPSHFNWNLLSCKDTVSRGQLKCDGTRAETRFRLSAKRTSRFKSAEGRQFSRLLAAEVCASAVVLLDTPCSEVVWRVLATHSIRQYPLHFPSLASPCAIIFQLEFKFCIYFLKRFISPTVHTGCTRTNYKIAPVTSLNKYLYYGTIGTELFAYKYRCKWRQWKIMNEKKLRLPVYWHSAFAPCRLALHSGVDTERQCTRFTGHLH